MANYSQNIFFGPKDTLASGDPAKAIKGTEVDGELNLISSAVTSKEDTANKGVANGYASLDAGILVPSAQIPNLAASKITSGSFAVARGGTGRATLTANALLVGAGTAAVEQLTPGAAGQVLRSNGTAWLSAVLQAGDIPSLDAAKITSGTFSVARGGTGLATLTANSLLAGNGTGNVALIAPGTSGNVLTSNGTSWTSAVLSAVPTSRTLTAGNGITGGGDLSANRTFTLGTPGTLTSATANGVTASSHTHSIGTGIMKAHVSTGGVTTVSTLDPTGGANGDVWYKV